MVQGSGAAPLAMQIEEYFMDEEPFYIPQSDEIE